MAALVSLPASRVFLSQPCLAALMPPLASPSQPSMAAIIPITPSTMTNDFDIREASEPSKSSNEKEFEKALRPLTFDDFQGQDKVKENLRIFVAAAKMRGESLDHTLFHGPPGLGKTTLSNIIANELGVGFKVTSGPVLDKPGDLAGLLTSLDKNDVLFIDEIHRLSPIVPSAVVAHRVSPTPCCAACATSPW